MEVRSRLPAEREAAIFAAVIRLVSEHGYEKLNLQQVASQAHSSTATLYRRWGGKPRLVVEALRHHRPPPLSDIDTGSLRGDFIEGARRMSAVAEEDEALMTGMGHAARTDRDLAEAMAEVLGHPMAEAAHRLIDRAIARGEIPAPAPAREFVPELLMAATLARRMVTGLPAGEDYLVRFVDTVILPALGAPIRDR
ncbi:TetR/AcrR family transcriptional regulator [Glycomyces albidus]|uniref:TetR family transcriptional regulator n=1 Tax=Glycomyces albidus TaxID=2656774 RepID=A0A6L5G894_9ACTN|nr:TetR/AcrR family transcriptional regulator [Glycomyces albidus]MQM25788.1 TetR family transcriptional regulator [Glycomyces albidus]